MSASDFRLTNPPDAPRARELWLQHAAGFILLSNIREYALGEIDQGASTEARNAAAKAVDDALYGLMMLVDGVTGGLRNPEYEVDVSLVVRLLSRGEEADTLVQEIDLRDGDGVCMGFHGWKLGDFGDEPVVAKTPPP